MTAYSQRLLGSPNKPQKQEPVARPALQLTPPSLMMSVACAAAFTQGSVWLLCEKPGSPNTKIAARPFSSTVICIIGDKRQGAESVSPMHGKRLRGRDKKKNSDGLSSERRAPDLSSGPAVLPLGNVDHLGDKSLYEPQIFPIQCHALIDGEFIREDMHWLLAK